MKRLTVIVALLVSMLGMQASAYDFPHQVWKWHDLYLKALESGDDAGIITNGLEIVRIMESAPEGQEKLNMIRSRLMEVGKAYERQGNYDSAAQTFQKYLTYSGEDDFDGQRVAKAKALQYSTQIRIFTEGGEYRHFGSKNEHQNGVMYGATSDGNIRPELPYESMVLVYHELGAPVSDWHRLMFQQASENDLVVEYALNCPRQRVDIQNIQQFSSDLQEISELFSQFSNVKAVLRFGAEFNEWSEPGDGAMYIDAFRYVSNYFKSRNNNVAIMWNPLQEGKWYLKLRDFYPGDAYVDWIGISAYSNLYHTGDPNMNPDYEVVYKSGKNADPVLAVKEIIDEFGQTKPVLISESGFSHRSITTGENTMEWAIQHLREAYAYLPMVYPQLKGICYFDKYVTGEINDYSLQGNLKNAYLEALEGPRMVQRGVENTYNYRELTDGSAVDSMTGIFTYAHIYGETTKKVTYYIDGRWVGESTHMPFGTYLELGEGAKELKVVAEGDKGTVKEKTFKLNASRWNPVEIGVTVNGTYLSFDQPPVLYCDRTLVPVRSVFEAMGATVYWDEQTNTVTGIRGNKIVKLVLGSNVMRVNETPVFLDVPAISVNNRTLVPARAIAESLGATVGWENETGTVVIKSE